MPPPRTRPEIRIPTAHEQYDVSLDNVPLSSLSPASLSTTLSSAAYYSTPQADNNMDISDDDFEGSRDDVVIKSEDSPGGHIEGLQGYPDSPSVVSPELPIKRKGRPRKNRTAGNQISKNKTNERSKTGCMTCRKRKKKCDETKPMCLNCTKTNYRCEGYPERREWQPSSGNKLVKRSDSPVAETKPFLDLPPRERVALFPAIENDLDMLLHDHFTQQTARVLSIHEGEDNPWIRHIMPMAKENSCLMHSVLALAGAHLARCDPRHASLTRHLEHHQQAIKVIQDEITQAQKTGELPKPIVAALLVNCLIPIMDGSTTGQYQWHLDAARNYVLRDDSEFGRFAWEIYKHYEFCKTLISLPKADRRPDLHLEYFERRGSCPSSPITDYIMLSSTNIRVGVLNGEFLKLVSDITHLRDRVRSRHLKGQRPAVDPLTFSSAERLDRALWDWQSGHAKGTARHVAAEMFRYACLCYLFRTVRGSRNTEDCSIRVTPGITCLKRLPPKDATQCTVLLPAFLLGCAAFQPEHRAEINKALDVIEEYSHMGNIEPARQVLKKLWGLMDENNDEKSWDWETVMGEMGYDVLIG